MTDSTHPGKRTRLVNAAVRVLHERGVEKTTIADIARAADVPVGNVYYYFKTKDQLVAAAIGAHGDGLQELIAVLERDESPKERLKALIAIWVDQRELAAKYGCPVGTLVIELDKRADGLDEDAAKLLHRLIAWVEEQFKAMGRDDAHDLAIRLVAAYHGMSLLTNAFRDPDVMASQGSGLTAWIDSLG